MEDFADAVVRRKLITFDLDTVRLESEFGIRRQKAYREIGRFMHKRGFDHRQGSVYVSIAPMSKKDVAYLMVDFRKTFPSYSECMKVIDVANIGKQYNLLPYLKDEERIGVNNWDRRYDENAYVRRPLSRVWGSSEKRISDKDLAVERKKWLKPAEIQAKVEEKIVKKDEEIEI